MMRAGSQVNGKVYLTSSVMTAVGKEPGSGEMSIRETLARALHPQALVWTPDIAAQASQTPPPASTPVFMADELAAIDTGCQL